MDTLGDMLTTVVNAQRVGKERVAVPYSSFKKDLADFLKTKGALGSVRVQEGVKSKLVISLAYDEAGEPMIGVVKRVSKPGRKAYVGHEDLPFTGGRPGFYVVSTSQGLMDQDEARKAKVGGELVCEVWQS